MVRKLASEPKFGKSSLEKRTENTRWSWRSKRNFENQDPSKSPISWLNSPYLCAQQTLSTSTGRKAWLPETGEDSPRYSGTSSDHFYRTSPASNWLCSLGQSASGGWSARHDTAGDTWGWLNELPHAGGRELDLPPLSFQVVLQKMTDALKSTRLTCTTVKSRLSHRNRTVNNAHRGQRIKGFKGSSSLQSTSQNCTFMPLFVQSCGCERDSFSVTRISCWHLSQLWSALTPCPQATTSSSRIYKTGCSSGLFCNAPNRWQQIKQSNHGNF